MARQLPRPLTSLIGRDAELEAITACLRRERLVSLVGAGGVGKTRLAIEAGVRDGREAAFVELAAVTGPGSVATAVAAALGIRESGTRSALDTIAHVLGEQQLLVILDNCEHVVDECSSLVDRLLRSCPQLAVLTTSREPLGVAGELVWRVPSLSVPSRDAVDVSSFDAVELFIDRARKVRPSLTISAELLSSVAEICRRLDGIALAIELAAATTRVMPPERILIELDHRFALLTGGPRTAMSRQQTLQASVEWSHDQLSDGERTVFHRLGVFTGPFPLEAAEVVAAGDGLSGWAVFDVLSRLVDKSLVVFDDSTGWYRLLETLRLFAVERCEAAADLAGTRAVHAVWWHDWLLAIGPDWSSDEACSSIDAGYPNIRTALRWLTVVDRDAAHDVVEALAAYWYMAGAITDALTLSDEVLDGELEARPARWARTVAATASIFWLARRPGILELVERASVIGAAAGDDLTVLRCEVLDLRGNPDVSRLADQAERAMTHGDRYLSVRILHTLALFDYLRGDGADSPAERRARELVDRWGRELGIGQSWLWSARARCAAGDYRGAWALQQAARSSPQLWRTPHTALYLMLDGVWFPLLLGDDDGVAAAAAETRALRRDWGRHQPLAAMIADLPALLAGAEPPSSLHAASESLGTVLLSFPPMLWLLFELLGPVTPRATDRSAADGIVDALAAARSFTEGDVHHAEPLLIRLSAFTREDQHFWLTMLAACAAARDALPVAARVFGAVDAFQHTAGTTWLPTVLRDRRTAALATCVGELGEQRLQALLTEGAAMSLAEAAAYASRARSKRGRPSFGWDSLTPTELDVVRRVAEGLGNAQIASALFMSTATVKTHLTHVYAKLGIATRAELAADAARRPVPG